MGLARHGINRRAAREEADAAVAAQTGKGWLVSRGSTQSISNNAWTSVQWDTETTDDAAYFDSGANTRISFAEAAWYKLDAAGEFTASATGRRGMRIRQNGSTVLKTFLTAADQVSTTFVEISFGPYKLAAGDYLEVQVYQDSTVSRNFTASNNYCTGVKVWAA